MCGGRGVGGGGGERVNKSLGVLLTPSQPPSQRRESCSKEWLWVGRERERGGGGGWGGGGGV